MSESLQRRGSSFFLPMLLLSRPKREAMKALYYFCRAADDAVDDAPSPQEALHQLAFWQEQIDWIYASQDTRRASTELHPITPLLAKAAKRYRMPRRYFDDLLSGLEKDCSPRVRIRNERELNEYCYQVAGCVGLQAMRIFGHPDETGEQFARALGQALQLTNILRDIEEDAQEGRCYLPLSWFKEAGVKEADPCRTILQDQLPVSLRRHIAIEAEMAFDEAERLAAELPTRDILPALLMRDIYQRKLEYLRPNGSKKPSKGKELGTVLAAALRYYLMPSHTLNHSS